MNTPYIHGQASDTLTLKSTQTPHHVCYRQRHLDERASAASTPNVITLIGARSEPRGRLGNDGRTRPRHALGQQMARKVRAVDGGLQQPGVPHRTGRQYVVGRRNSAEAGSRTGDWWSGRSGRGGCCESHTVRFLPRRRSLSSSSSMSVVVATWRSSAVMIRCRHSYRCLNVIFDVISASSIS